MEQSSKPSDSFLTRSDRQREREAKLVRELRQQDNRTRQLFVELLELRHDRLLYDIPQTDGVAKAAKEGGALEMRYILKKILTPSDILS